MFTIEIPTRLQTRNHIVEIKGGDSGRRGAMLFGLREIEAEEKGAMGFKETRVIDEMMEGGMKVVLDSAAKMTWI